MEDIFKVAIFIFSFNILTVFLYYLKYLVVMLEFMSGESDLCQMLCK